MLIEKLTNRESFELKVPRPSLDEEGVLRTKLPGTLAEFLVAISRRGAEPKTARELAAQCGLGIRTLQTRCKEAHTSAKACLDFLHCLSVVCDDHGDCDPRSQLPHYCTDRRIVARYVSPGGPREARPAEHRARFSRISGSCDRLASRADTPPPVADRLDARTVDEHTRQLSRRVRQKKRPPG